ncbi:putative enterotoxin [Ophiocordyceps camponoti-floridani]|uniref:Putative enterotoxin n=1 Tax=Ophiocordyceps camponoti-floridani TaxID=2030778 RepID=A0A8H4Q970_9HYPO|nr:putative enterotoxin [Ophiocordyceps camponoti-floridani]
MHITPLILTSLCIVSSGLGADTGCGSSPKLKWPLTSKPSKPPTFVFRGDARKPAAIRAEGGWLPWSIPYRTPLAFGLYNHERDVKFAKGQRDTVYVSTTTSFDVAARYARMNEKGREETYIYYIHATPNMIDLNLSLGNETNFWWQREFSAMGGIRWSQVVGWVRANASFFDAYNYSVPDCGFEDLNNAFFHRRLQRRCSEGFYTASLDYCEARWAPFTAGGFEPQLSGFAEYENDFVEQNRPRWFRVVAPWSKMLGKSTMKHAYEFMNRTRRATGWKGEFPLFNKNEPERACAKLIHCPMVRS